MTEIESFPPVASPRARVLILGSMPSVRSLADGEYYAHPQNRFWPFMGELLGAGRDKSYQQRLRVLARAGIALWDVVHRCRRTASADATMRDVEPNDIPGLLARCPRIAAVFSNGRKAQELFERLIADRLPRRLHVEYLPSTSPANASMSPSRKLERWRTILDWIRA